jgi:hypothetical protein
MVAAIIVIVLSVIITVLISGVINKNTIGTTGAYAKRGFITWVIVFFILIAVANKMGLIS